MAARSIVGSHLTTLGLWTIVPPFLSRVLLSTFYYISPASRPTVSPSSTPSQVTQENQRATSHARRARIILVCAYLTYTILSTYHSQSSSPAFRNFYALLDLPRATVEAEGSPAVKSHFRRLARTYHPDKVGADGADHFVMLRKASECLEDENQRWGYERFGPSVLDWKGMRVKRDFIVHGSQGAVAFYLFAAGSFVLLAVFRKEERGYSFWRTITFLCTLSLEFFLSLRPTPSPLISLLAPNRLPFEHIALLRQLFLAASLAFTQLAPLLSPPLPPLPTLEEVDREVAALQTDSFRPLLGLFSSDNPIEATERQARVLEEIKASMVDLMTEIKIRQHPELSKVWAKAVAAGMEREEKRRRAHLNPQPSVTGKASDPPVPPSSPTVTASVVVMPKEAKRDENGRPFTPGRLPSPPPDE